MNKPLNENLSRLADEIVDSYRSDERTHRIGHSFLPARERIVGMFDEIRQLLFPGFFGSKSLTAENVHHVVGGLLVRVGEALTQEIYNCLCVNAETCDPGTCSAKAEQIACEMLSRVPKIRQSLALDAQAAYDGDPAAKGIDEIIYCYPGFYAVTVYRVAHELLELGVPLMPRILSEHAHSETGTDIHPGAKIGKSFFIDHATGVVIGETTWIGDNVKIYQGVTLGAKSFPKDERGRVIKGLQRHPTIENNVTIYANATILGGDTVIGRGVTVSGNTFVTSSVDEGSLVRHESPKLHVRSKDPSKGAGT